MEVKTIDISVVIPAYQAEQTIERAIESVLALRCAEIEVVVVNDGSTDGTARIVERMQDADPRVMLVNQVNKGRSAARNEGIRRTRGNWVMFVDADDFLVPEADDRIDAALRGMRKEPALVVFGMLLKGDRSRFTARVPDENEVQGRNSGSVIEAGKLAEGMVCGTWRDSVMDSDSYQIDSCWARLYRADSIRRMMGKLPQSWGPFPLGTRFSEDRLFNVAFLSANSGEKVEFFSSPVYGWDFDASSTAAVVKEDDISNLPVFYARLSEAVGAGAIAADDARAMTGAQAIEQFRRPVVNPGGFKLTPGLLENWNKALDDERIRACLPATPDAYLGNGRIWKLASVLLASGRVKSAFVVYGAMFRLKKGIGRAS